MDIEGTENETLSNEELDSYADEQLNTSTNREIPMEKTPEAPAPEKTQEDKYIEFVANGKPVKATQEQLIRWAQQSQGHTQRLEQFKADQAKWEQQKKQWEVYKQVDDYAKQNPQWWERVQGQFQNKDQPQTQNPGQTDAHYQALQSKIDHFEKNLVPIVEQLSASSKAQEEKAQDEALNQEISTVREKYKDKGFDFDQLDDSGKTLENRVIDHAIKNGIRSFHTAFKDMCHDDILSRTENLAKQSLSKEVQKRTKLGILGESPSPRRVPSEATNVKNKSYEGLLEEALAELQGA